MPFSDTFIFYGQPVKTLEKSGDLVTVGGHLVVFDDPADPVRDLEGDYFTKDSYFGARKGDGAECCFHHGIPIKSELSHLSRHFFEPLKVEEDEMGLFASTVLDLRKDYEATVYGLVEQKSLGWSSGAVGHLVHRENDGWLKTWIIGEGSLTPTPAEPRTSALSLKSLMEGGTGITAPVKAESLQEKMQSFYRAWDQQIGYGWLVDVFDRDGYVIAEASGQTYRVPFSEEGEEITYAVRNDWQEVERVVSWEAKMIHEAFLQSDGQIDSDLLALQLKMHNLTTQTRLNG